MSDHQAYAQEPVREAVSRGHVPSHVSSAALPMGDATRQFLISSPGSQVVGHFRHVPCLQKQILLLGWSPQEQSPTVRVTMVITPFGFGVVLWDT